MLQRDSMAFKRLTGLLGDVSARTGHNLGKVVQDWVRTCLLAILRDDEEYLKAIEPYTRGEAGQRPIDRMVEAFSLLVQHTEAYEEEVLGALFMELNSKWTRGGNGQFFTPPAVATMMARMNEPQPGQRILDPACGAGAMLVESAKMLPRDRRHEPFFMGIDIDPNCVNLCALNSWIFNLNAVVIHGNALSGECWGGYQALADGKGGRGLVRLDKEDLAGIWTVAMNTLKPAA